MKNSNLNIKDFGGKLRERSTDYIQIAKNTLDSYPNGLAHGLNKDTIQNGWDACMKKTKHYVENNWGMDFEIIEDKERGRFLVIVLS